MTTKLKEQSLQWLLKEATAAATAVDPKGGGYDLQWWRLLPKWPQGEEYGGS
uniref:Uncharacterized protein n=1 Tax=Oryza barthii TaxID=65489 RepID=A0A0D3GPN5_9ORYZ